MSARRPRTDAGTGLTFVGAPFDLFRVAQSVPLDQAELNFDAYVTTTLAYSAMYGGRFNRIGEFGALYTTLDEDTAWIDLLP